MTTTSAAIIAAIGRSKTRSLSITEMVRAIGADRAEVQRAFAQLVQAGAISRSLGWSADRITERWSVVRARQEAAE